MAPATGKCHVCGHDPVAFDARVCPTCGARNPNPGVTNRHVAKTAPLGVGIGALIGALIGGVWGYFGFAIGFAGAFGGALLGALPGLVLGLFLGFACGLCAHFTGRSGASQPTAAPLPAPCGIPSTEGPWRLNFARSSTVFVVLGLLGVYSGGQPNVFGLVGVVSIGLGVLLGILSLFGAGRPAGQPYKAPWITLSFGCAVLLVVGIGAISAGVRGRAQADAPVAGTPAAVPFIDRVNEPEDADAYATRAYDWLCKDQYDEALKDYDRAIQLEPNRAEFWNARGLAWRGKGIEDRDRSACEDRALSDYAEAIRLDPKYASAINNRAWLRATSKVDRCRDGKAAVEEATKACELTGWRKPGLIDTLSCAYAEVGDFEQAIRWQKKALENPRYQREEGENARTKLELFGRKQPFRE